METIKLTSKQNSRYVRVFCEKNNDNVAATVSIYEVEIYNGEVPTIARPLPNKVQIQYQKEELSAFIHFGMNTFTDRELGTGTEDEKIFNPTDINTDQWIKSLANAGFARAIITAKHHDGFCLWPSKYTTHSVASSSWLDGKGDVVKMVSDSCGKYGVKFGFYLSPWDKNSKYYGKGDDYNSHYMNQLIELLTNYGPISEVWIDSTKDSNVNQDYKYLDWFTLIKKFHPNCLIYSSYGPDARLIGSENGYAGEPCWSLVKLSKMGIYTPPSYLGTGEENGDAYIVGESNVSIRPNWFYHANEDGSLKTLSELMDIYFNSVGKNTSLLLNIPPNSRGLFADGDVQRLKEFGDSIKATFATNFALNKTVTTDSVFNNSTSFNGSKIVDGNYDTYWSPKSGATTGTIEIDLGKATLFDIISIQEYIPLGQNIAEFNVQILQNGIFNTVFSGKTIGYKRLITLVPIIAQKIRVNISRSIGTPLINSIGVYKQYNKISLIDQQTNSNPNLVLGKTAVSSSNETATLTPNFVTDGDILSTTSRWSSGSFNNGQQWIYVDLAQITQFDTVRLYWETANATIYRIEVSNDATNWTSVYRTTTGEGGLETISLTSKQNARYVRVYCEKNNPAIWTSVSLFEIEIYNGVPQDATFIISKITELTVNTGDSKLTLPSIPSDFNIEVLGSDFNAIIDRNGNIYQPLLNTTVTITIKVTDSNGRYATKELSVLVPGVYKGNTGTNKKPNVIPNLREWLPSNGTFTFSNTSRIVIDSNYSKQLNKIANKFITDYKYMTLKDINVIVGTPINGDIFITLNCDDKGIGNEGYYIYINDYVKVEAISTTGAFFSTRTILQILKQYNNTIAKGIIRDYPKYECRGFMLDVGRKFFTLDFLKQYLEVMAWYKMNEFQIHINDNYIWITEDTWQTDYDAFRLECTTYPGLTAKDGYYTKNAYRDFVNVAKDYGVKIITEIDTPAHCLSFTKYRPSLALGPGKGRDHLNVQSQDTYTFINNLYKEYLEGFSPVFGNNEFHIGNDEYFGTKEQLESFRAYTDYYLKQIRDNYKITPRIWGSLSQIKGTTPITSTGVTMNIWNIGWADANEMINTGFNIINSIDSDLYIVPLAGYYRDYLDIKNLFNNWNANNFGSYSISPSHSQLRGAMFAIWNDKIGRIANGICELDVYDRALPATQVIAEKLWGGTTNRTFDEFTTICKLISDIPNSNLRYNVPSMSTTIIKYTFDSYNATAVIDTSGNNYHGKYSNISFVTGKNGKAIKLNGGSSYIQTPINNKGPVYTVTIWVNKDTNGDYNEQILAESDISIFKATQIGTSNVGFSREGYHYSFNYKLPENQWIKLTLAAKLHETKLFVNDVLKDTINIQNGGKAGTFIFPLTRLGSTTKAFKGMIDEFTIESI